MLAKELITMPLDRNNPRRSMKWTYAAMRVFTGAQYDGVTLDDYVDVGDQGDDGPTVVEATHPDPCWVCGGVIRGDAMFAEERWEPMHPDCWAEWIEDHGGKVDE